MNDMEVLGLFDALEDRLENLQKLTATGHIFASGDVWIDSDGISLRGEDYTSTSAANALQWQYDDSGTDYELGEIYGDYYPTPTFKGSMWMIARRRAGSPWTNGTIAIIAAIDAVTTADVRIQVDSGGTVETTGATVFKAGCPFQLISLAAAPASPSNGWIYYDSGLGKFRGYENGGWVNLV